VKRIIIVAIFLFCLVGSAYIGAAPEKIPFPLIELYHRGDGWDTNEYIQKDSRTGIEYYVIISGYGVAITKLDGTGNK
jgi:hypothetical protein